MSWLSERFTHRPGRHRPRPLRDGTILLVVIGALLYAGYTKSIPLLGKGGTVVEARFSDATHVQKGNAVRVAGVDVGEVESVRLDAGRRGAVVKMRIDDGKGVEVHDDARANLWWRTLLGRNMYIELDPGSKSAPKLGDREIPVSRTQVQQEFDQVLEPLGDTQRAAIKKVIASFDDAAKDPEAIGGTIDALEPSMKHLRQGLPSLRGTQQGDLTRLVREASHTMGALGASEEQLAGLIDNGSTALGVTAARHDELGSTLDQGAPTMDDTRRTLARLRTTLDTLDPVAVDLLPGAERLKPAAQAARPMLARLDRVLDDAEPTLRSLRPAVTRLAETVDPGEAVINGLRPTVDRANKTILPWLAEKDPDTKLKNYASIGPFFSVLASAASIFDGNGNLLNFQTAPDERTAMSVPCTLRLTDPSAAPENKINCEALGDFLSILTGGQGAPSTDYPADPPSPEDVPAKRSARSAADRSAAERAAGARAAGRSAASAADRRAADRAAQAATAGRAGR
ncbi:virulence factor Mce family protein [Patulibacter medicamentivorans]|uniref:Virulence factor Mce family protein n=1 Tax=Patulibacter medicamentivorans TaxID=1097667 RepID=H0E7N6_9ACTN|nr:MlaD family protein [Patulibacter medicamentivorans]EHN10310.1 virulence factor Mce family protein [Patulibacter medicamentivorans]